MNLYILIIIELLSSIYCSMIYGVSYDRFVYGLVNYNPMGYLFIGLIQISILWYLITYIRYLPKNWFMFKIYKIVLIVIILINISLIIR